jgi:DNA-binding LacI/PurR family transcriptional regulator
VSSSIKLKNIAALAQVSISSVSRVLSNKGYVSQEARERVLNAMAELTTHDTSARVRQPRIGLSIGLFLQRESFVDRDPMTSVDVTTVVRAFENRGHSVVIYDLDRSGDEALALAAHGKGRLDAAIVNDDDTQDTVGRFLNGIAVPWIATNGYSTKISCHVIDNDNEGGSREIISHLLDLGHTQIGLIIGQPYRWVSENRLDACRAEYTKRGLLLDESLIEPGFFKLNGGFQACNTLLERCPQMTAIYAFNDLSAIGAVRALRDRNLRVPDDISVVGFDDMEIATFSDPPLTTVSRFHPALSHFLVQGVEDMVTYAGLATLKVLTEAKMIVRRSSEKKV